MSSDKLTSGPTIPRPRMLWLVLAHVVIGLLGALVSYLAGRSQTWRGATFLGLVFSQTSLLGIWGSLGASPWWKRLIGVVVSVGCLGLLLGVGIFELNRQTFLVVVIATTFVAMPLMIVRFLRVAIQPLPVASVGRIQFSIRHLMILTFIVACLITIGKWVQPLPLGAMFFRLLLFGVTFGLVGVLPVWFVLATKQPLVYSVGLMAVGACVGYCLGRFFHDDVGIWTTVTATEAMVVVVSLLIVRSCGYRLVRLPLRRQDSRDGAT